MHNNRTKTSNSFIVLRENYATLQACAFVGEHISEEMIKFIGGIPCESIIDVVGRVKIP